MKHSTALLHLKPLWLTLPLALYASGCVEVAPPDDAQIQCTNNADCPSGWTCKTDAEGTSLCVDTTGTNADVDPPELAGTPLITPALGTDGTRFTVCFSANESLSSDPVVNLNAGAGLIVLEAAESKPEACADHTYAYQWTASADKAAAGTHPLTVTLFDEALNKADGLSLGNLSLDFAAPVLSSHSLSASVASTGQEVTLALNFNEAIEGQPQVTMATGGGAQLAWSQLSATDEQSFVYAYTPSGAEVEGVYLITVAAQDAAGNSHLSTLSSFFTLDFDAPVLAAPTIFPSTLVGPGQAIEVTFAVSSQEVFTTLPTLTAQATGNAATPPSFGAGSRDGDEILYTDTIRSSDCAGTTQAWDLVLSGGVDEAGNAMATQTFPAALLVDCEAPSLTSCIYPAGSDSSGPCPDVDPLQYKAGEEVFIELTLSEEASATVYLDSDELDTCSQDGLSVLCTRLVGNEEGQWVVTTTLTDTLGNTTDAFLGTVHYDGIAPLLLGRTIAPNPANGTSSIEVAFSFSEDVKDVVLESDGFSFGEPTITGQTYVYAALSSSHTTGSFDLWVTATDEAGNTLLDGTVGTLQVDADFPHISIINVQTTAGLTPPRVAFEDTLSFDLDTGGEELTSLDVLFGGQSLSSACGPFQEVVEVDYRCSYTLPATGAGAGEENSVSLLVNGSDEAGNLTAASETIVVDNKPPELTAAQVTYEPGPDNVLALVTAAKTGASALLAFSTNEPATVGEVTATCTGDAAWTQTTANGAQTYFVYQHTVGNENDASDCYLKATLTDVVGNVRAAEEGLALKIDPAGAATPENFSPDGLVVIDNTPPNAFDSNVLDVSGIKHVRIPFGAVQSNYESAQYVAARDAANLEPLDGTALPTGIVAEEVRRVRFFDAQSGGIQQSQAENLNAAIKLNSTDSPELFAEVVDYAGNISERVRVVSEYVSTFAPNIDAVTPNQLNVVFDKATQGLLPRTVEDEFWSGMKSIDGDTTTLQEFTWTQIEYRSPSLDNYGLTYDAARKVTVLFGGLNFVDTTVDGTYEYDGIGWRYISVQDPEYDGNPAARMQHSLAYDAARGVVVLFGGRSRSNLNPFSDTWEYDGVSWAQITPTDAEGNGPKGRFAHAMVYDAALGKTVLFGGVGYVVDNESDPCGDGNLSYSTIGCIYGDTWAFDGTAWEKILDTAPSGLTAPGPRSSHAMVFHATLGKTVLFGGSGSDRFGDTWAFDGNGWEKILDEDPSGSTAPSPRFNHAMTYDASRSVTVLLGGHAYVSNEGDPCGDGNLAGPNGWCSYEDTWEYDGQSWTEITHTDTEDDGNPPSVGGLSYDAARGVTISRQGDTTWEYDGTHWRRVNYTNDTYNLWWPSWDMSTAYDSNRGRIVTHGGRYYSWTHGLSDLSGTEEYDGAWQTPNIADSNDDGSPAKRSRSSMAYDENRAVAVLFGGYSQQYGPLNDTWEYDGFEWVRFPGDFSGAPRPQKRSGHSLVYDGGRGVIVLFGGYSISGSPLNDTWEYDTSGWRYVSPNDPEGDGIPYNRYNHSMAYDAARQVIVLYGGDPRLYDTWEYNGDSWKYIVPSDPEDDGNPVGRQGHSLTYDKQREVVVLFGGYSPELHSDVWEYNGESWKKRTFRDPENDGNPSGRIDCGFTYHEGRNAIVLHGGRREPVSTALVLSDTWELSPVQTGFAFPSRHLNIRPSTLQMVLATAIIKPENNARIDFRLDAKPGTFHSVSESDKHVVGDFEILTHTITEPAKLRQLAVGHNQAITARFDTENLDPNATPQPINLDYMELRLLYDLDHDNTQIEPACGDGVTQPWLGEACDDLNNDDDDYCSFDCTQELGSCGDGVIQESAGEVCDGETDTHWCSSDCWYALAKCSVGYHNGGDGTCVVETECSLGYAADMGGNCTLCATGYHDGGDGACVLETECSLGYALDMGGECTLCANGYHDGGDGSCVLTGTCSTDYHDGGAGTCVLETECSLGYALDMGGECTLCATGYHDGGDGTCVPEGDCVPGYCEDDSCLVSPTEKRNCADGLTCIDTTDSDGNYSHAVCKRKCDADADCPTDQLCADGLLTNGQGICGDIRAPGESCERGSGYGRWYEGSSWCWDLEKESTTTAWLACLDDGVGGHTCQYYCDYLGNEWPRMCPPEMTCSSTFTPFNGYYDLRVCEEP